ncbi:hypothetical protein jhhlp_003959 [Lomentospora prolificans]|uniref:PH domain-containing protein n=1 Tax=Lomentospora prolificans TaxID=41688 RepID=A0A2N3NA76_9PEZI|nr:hypothetical protein jhhlp_003959 [Lomentospora prolificans]
MASFFSDKPSLAESSDKENDPFIASPNQPPLRFSSFDSKLFALGPASSPGQAKRALEAHLAETERRMAEAGKLGTALVHQQKELRERLAEVESMQTEGQLSHDLRQKLAEIERDYNDVARQTARAFLPKQRVPSNEAAAGSPYVPEGKGGRRSVSPSKFESQATGSPTKLSIPNRKLRNQPANRIHDIEFAAEISTSLIAQVRNLQALLAEKDEELRDVKTENSKLELDTEGLQQRLKVLDESEHRYKEENWNLETQMQELYASQKEAAEREKRLTQSLNVLQAEKTKFQRELDEVKLSHAKLTEEHAASMKQHDIELGTAKRNIVTAENERLTMQRKLDDLTSQNQELARAFSSQRSKISERGAISGLSEDDFETATDNLTPEHSPPPSPVKGTPRHSVLESETLKTSLQHAQRTIQSQRTQLHREKTEKLELKRMLQDARDEVERLRGEGGGVANRRSKRMDTKDAKKFSKLLLGGARSSREEIHIDDPEWEEQQSSPRLPQSRSVSPGTPRSPSRGAESTDHFETANETSDAAFETANERGTETEDFQTGAEEFSGSESEATETESPSRGIRHKRSAISMPINFRKHPNRESFHSTASTSNDEEDAFEETRTPTSAQPPPRMRLRVSRGLLRRSRQASEEPPALQSSPASFANSSASGTPRQPGQSLFAELGDFDGSDDESYGGTPSRNLFGSSDSISSIPPLRPFPSVVRLPMVDSGVMTESDPSKADLEESVDTPTAIPKPTMVDAGTMTEQVEEPILSPVSVIHFEQPTAMVSEIERPMSMDSSRFLSLDEGTDGDRSRPVSTFSYSDSGAQYDAEIEDKLSKFPLPPTLSKTPSVPTLGLASIESQEVAPVAEPAPVLGLASIHAQCVEPIAPPELVLGLTSIQTQDVEPVSESEPVLGLASIETQQVAPVVEPEPPVAALALSSIHVEALEPRVEPVIPPALSISSIQSEVLDPKAAPEVLPPAPDLSVSQIHSQALEPDNTPLDLSVAEALGLVAVGSRAIKEAPPAPELSMTAIESQDLEPRPEPDVVASPPELSLAAISSQELEPEAEPAPSLSMTAIHAEALEPKEELVALPTLTMAGISSQALEPKAEPEVYPSLSLAGINSLHVEPLEEPQILPVLSMTNISSQELEPRVEPEPPAPEPAPLGFSSVRSEHIHPIAEPEPKPVVLTTSSIRSEFVAPISPKPSVEVLPKFGFTSIQSVETRPVSPRSPRRDGFILPRNLESSFDELPKPKSGFVRGSVLGWDRERSSTPPIIAEDETRQSPTQPPQPETPESQRPLRDMSANSNARPPRRTRATMSDSEAQTALTSDALDQMLVARESSVGYGHARQESLGSSMGTPGTVRVRRGSTDSTGSVIRHRSKLADAAIDRPGSPASVGLSGPELPPLPANHKQVIEAARSGSSGGGQGASGSMGPPAWPASALKARPITPATSRPGSPSKVSAPGSPTPRAVRTAAVPGHVGVKYRSRQSSVTSFASELDNRFNMQVPGMGMGMGPDFGPNTDPRMIQAITQTMIGEFLWKYTRKTGRGDFSENRHRRYFWVHPYTRTLYWSDRDPTTAGRAELKAKSVPIEAVRVVTDDNPMPPGLHRKSLVVISPGRTIKFTCTTGQRHETWFNALSYLLLRTTDEAQSDTEEMAGHITQEDVDEFNPQFGQRRAAAPNTTGRRPVPPSLSSYNSRATRHDTSALEMSMNMPTLTPAKGNRAGEQRPSHGTLTRLSGYWKSGQVFSSLRSRNTITPDLYERNEVHDSAEDLRAYFERQDRESDRLENVRACCDGKHDVGTLPRASKRHRVALAHLSHSHPGATASTPASTTRSRA